MRSYCARHDLPYNETGWARALLDTHLQIRDGWRVDEVIAVRFTRIDATLDNRPDSGRGILIRFRPFSSSPESARASALSGPPV